MLIEYFDTYVQKHKPYKGGSWCYEDGLIYRGLELLHRSTGDPRWLAHLKRLIAPQILEGPALLGYDANEYNIDHVMSGRALLLPARGYGRGALSRYGAASDRSARDASADQVRCLLAQEPVSVANLARWTLHGSPVPDWLWSCAPGRSI